MCNFSMVVDGYVREMKARVGSLGAELKLYCMEFTPYSTTLILFADYIVLLAERKSFMVYVKEGN